MPDHFAVDVAYVEQRVSSEQLRRIVPTNRRGHISFWRGSQWRDLNPQSSAYDTAGLVR
jgi:hypothetical protein